LKTLEFLNSRRPELEIRGTFIQQLQDYEQRLARPPHNLGPLSTSWSETAFTKQAQNGNNPHTDIMQEEVILRNTFMNAKMGPIAHYLGGAFANQTKTF